MRIVIQEFKQLQLHCRDLLQQRYIHNQIYRFKLTEEAEL